MDMMVEVMLVVVCVAFVACIIFVTWAQILIFKHRANEMENVRKSYEELQNERK